ncbi:MAG: HDOD domain-containing protein [Cellvibrionaceae bacterium]
MDLNNLIANAQNMPNIPKVVQELIESFNADNVDSEQIADKVSKDQAMTAKVLRMANSAKYGGHRQVGSVNDAIVLLGFNSLRTLVLASGLTGAFKTPEGFDIREFWKKSFSIASLSKWLAKFTPDVDNEVAFTSGMLYDVGGLLTHILVNEQALEIDRVVAKGADRIEMESSRLGFTYPEAGAELANRWKFPQEIVEGIRHQIEPQVSEEGYKPLAGILFIAQYLYENQASDSETLIANFPFEHSAKLNIDKVSLIDNIEEIKELDAGIDELLD